MEDYKLLSERFEKFKNTTKEENRIIDLIKSEIPVHSNWKVLDIGSNKGTISHAIQSNSKNITLVDVENFDIKTGARFLKGTWENLNVDETFDLIIASHVWGHFYHNGTTAFAFQKALDVLKRGGLLVLCYNTNSGIIGELIDLSKKLFSDFQYDIFDESLIHNLDTKEFAFKVTLKETAFKNLTDLIQTLIIVPDQVYESKKSEIRKYFETHLPNPEFLIDQKIVVVKKH